MRKGIWDVRLRLNVDLTEDQLVEILDSRLPSEIESIEVI